ncbi:hypothetical protein LJ725_15150 [Reyranella aquatilis]|uniref:Uncharacterized protein n=1 Tax=Reyranella aquatilis TaxID=2035356 RepID=A0ABS8KW64_9HYPH|nr:hypothetical protein [Reyranella aquatilis]MCC8430311.1 hypothetical protein [Reyranella aquatilis]
MDSLHRRGDLRVGGGKQAGDLFGHGLIGGKAGKLGLPEIQVTAGQPVEIGGGIARRTACRVVVFGGHARTITHRRAFAAFASAKPALSHCGIGAKVNDPSKRAFTAHGS